MDEVNNNKTKRRGGRRGKGGGNRSMTALQIQPQDDIIIDNQSKIQVLREDHEEMLSTRAALQQDLSVAQQHLRQLVGTARKVREDTDLEVKAVLERSIGVESQLGAIHALQSEHAQVVAHVSSLAQSNIQLESEFNRLESELHRIRMDAAEVAHLKADLHALRLHLRQGRGAIEFEKKTRTANLQQYQEMDTKIAEMSNQIHTLQLRPRLPPSHHQALGLGYAGPSHILFRDPNPMHQATAPPPVAAGDAIPPPTGGHHPFETRHAYLPTR